MNNKNNFIAALCCIFFLSFTFANVVLTLDGQNLNYVSSDDIAGWQFGHDGCVDNASGGDSATAGFTISTGSSTVLAFSFSGAFIPSGSGTLVEIAGGCDPSSLSNFVLSGPGGTALESEFIASDPEPVLGCIESAACNYDADATEDDGSCIYAEENFDCDGNCVVEVDCAGECGGAAVVDECGDCGGDGS